MIRQPEKRRLSPFSLDSRRDEAVQSQLLYCGIGVDREKVFVKGRIDSDHIFDLVVHLELERVHRRIKVDLYGDSSGKGTSVRDVLYCKTSRMY